MAPAPAGATGSAAARGLAPEAESTAEARGRSEVPAGPSFTTIGAASRETSGRGHSRKGRTEPNICMATTAAPTSDNAMPSPAIPRRMVLPPAPDVLNMASRMPP